MRRRAKVDDNHKAISEALRSVGATVQSLAMVGAGCPDLLVGYHGRNFLLEVKNPNQPPNKRQLTPDEYYWHLCWRGQVHEVLTAENAWAAIGAPVPSSAAYRPGRKP